ncbi:hypothetical protein D6764_05515 [Candidatus Woesearchaeota archaeon]|nr:MAG: hypothetical protein D6764_05515 [Candidatus Woesearchaeota archaeon]
MKVSELQPRQGKVEITGKVTEVGQVREFQKFGNTGRVANAKLQDESGEITLTLWNEQIDMVKPGCTVRISNGYVSEWQGEKQLSTGRFGKLEVLEQPADGETSQDDSVEVELSPDEIDNLDDDIEEEFVEEEEFQP